MSYAPKVERPVDLYGTTYKVPVNINGAPQTLYVTVNGAEGRPLEVFAVTGKAGSSIRVMTDCISRLISCQLQDGVDPERLAEKHLVNMKGGDPVLWPAEQTFVLSIPDALGKALRRWMRQNPPIGGYKKDEPHEDEDVGEEVAGSDILPQK